MLSGPLEPTNEPYAIAKIAGIKLCESYHRQYGVDYRSVMPTNLYGPGIIITLKIHMPSLGLSGDTMMPKKIKKLRLQFGEVGKRVVNFFSEFIKGEGRIPIEIHETLSDAKNKQHQYIKKKMKCFLGASHETLDANLNTILLPYDSIKKRVKALLYRLDGDAIVIYLG